MRKVDLAELTQAMNAWLMEPGTNLREEIAAWASERDIEAD